MVCMELLVDYLEAMSAQLEKLSGELQKMNAQYKTHYDRELRKDIEKAKLAIGRKKWEIKNELYKNVFELILIKRYYPKFLEFLISDPYLGSTVSKVAWLTEVEELSPQEAHKSLETIRKNRRSLREAKKALEKYGGKVDAKELTKQWPVLKGVISGIMDRDDAVRAVEERGKKLKREGWKVIVGSDYIIMPLKKLLRDMAMARAQTSEKEKELHSSKGMGSVSEYGAKTEYEKALKKLGSAEGKCIQILLANPKFLDRVKKGTAPIGDRVFMQLVSALAFKIRRKEINEIRWLGEMKAKLS